MGLAKTCLVMDVVAILALSAGFRGIGICLLVAVVAVSGTSLIMSIGKRWW